MYLGEDNLLLFKPSIRMEKKRDLSDFEHGMVVDARRAGLSISKKCWSTEIFTHNPNISKVYREWSEKEENIQCGSCVDKKALLMSEVRGEWADWLEMIERQQ